MPFLVMLTGAPGSGKSTYGKEVEVLLTKANGLPTIVLSTDDYVQWIADRHGSTYNEMWKDFYKSAESHMMTMLEFAIEKGWNILWDQTNLNEKVRIRKLARIPNHYVKISSTFDVDLDTLFERNKEREKIGKKLPDFVIRNAQLSLEYPILKEGFNFTITQDFELLEIRRILSTGTI